MPRTKRQPYQQQKAKKEFLEAFARYAILHKACDIAGIHTATVRYWLGTGFLQQHELDAAKEAYNDRIRLTLHNLAAEGIDRPLIDGHGHILTDASGNPLLSNTKSEKLLIQMAKVHLQEHRDVASGHTSNTVNISIGDIHSTYYVGIDLHHWQLEDVQQLKALIIEAESHKRIPDGHSVDTVHSQTIIDSQ